MTGRRIFDRLWEIADRLGEDRNPYRVGFLHAVCVAETDAKAEQLYKKHAEYFFQKGIGSIPMERLTLPGGIDIRGLEFIFRDPGDFGLYAKMREASFAELVDAGARHLRQPEDGRRHRLVVLPRFPDRKSARDAAVRVDAAGTDEVQHRPIRGRGHARAEEDLGRRGLAAPLVAGAARRCPAAPRRTPRRRR